MREKKSDHNLLILVSDPEISKVKKDFVLEGSYRSGEKRMEARTSWNSYVSSMFRKKIL